MEKLKKTSNATLLLGVKWQTELQNVNDFETHAMLTSLAKVIHLLWLQYITVAPCPWNWAHSNKVFSTDRFVNISRCYVPWCAGRCWRYNRFRHVIDQVALQPCMSRDASVTSHFSNIAPPGKVARATRNLDNPQRYSCSNRSYSSHSVYLYIAILIGFCWTKLLKGRNPLGELVGNSGCQPVLPGWQLVSEFALTFYHALWLQFTPECCIKAPSPTSGRYNDCFYVCFHVRLVTN